jgi:hypothetical protein
LDNGISNEAMKFFGVLPTAADTLGGCRRRVYPPQELRLVVPFFFFFFLAFFSCAEMSVEKACPLVSARTICGPLSPAAVVLVANAGAAKTTQAAAASSKLGVLIGLLHSPRA